jgi:3-phenylpropionate/trans-cinnamate dioxygenase ferredoxin reductase subunit
MNDANVILGAGQAGGWAAVAMREAGFDGPIVLIGDERHAPYERPILSKKVLTEAELPGIPHLHDETRYHQLGIELRRDAAAVSIDPERRLLRLSDDQTVGYDKLLLATGGRARRLGIEGGELVLYLRTWDDALKIRHEVQRARKVIAIGAGVIGLEIASSARALGCDVTVLEAGHMPMGRCLSPEGIGFVTSLHQNAGVDLRFKVAVEAITRHDDGYSVRLCDGSSLDADCVVAGIGMERNTTIAAAAGIAVDNGILVDEHGRTNIEDIYAAGDVAAFWHPALQRHVRLESWRHAQNHGLAVGRGMAGTIEAYDELPWFWTEQHGVNLQVAGSPSAAHRTILRESGVPKTICAFHLDEKERVIAVTTANDSKAAKAGQMLIRSNQPVDLKSLSDPTVSLQALVAAARKSAA